MATAYNPSVVTDGLVLCLDAGNPRSYSGSGTAWTDLSGRGNNGTLTNGPTYSSANGGAIVFDGTDDGATIGKSVSQCGLTTWQQTWCIWFRRTANAATFDHVWGALGFQSGIVFDSSTDVVMRWHYYVTDWNTHYKTSVRINMPLNTWKYVCGVLDNSGGKMILYENGKQITSFTITTMAQPWNGTVRIAGGGYGNAPIDVACSSAYNRALSAAEVAQNFNALRGRFGV